MLLDRQAQQGALDRLLETVRTGLSGALVLRGEPGIGKTVLLDYAVRSADDMQIARVVGVESEIELGFAALHHLLIPFLDALERLPERQRDALGSAFGLLAGVAPDRFMVGLAALTLLADAAAERPLLCVIDDAQWLDQASVGVLAFVARRLFADRIGMLFAVRDAVERWVALEGLSELRLSGLPDGDARELLASVAVGRVDERVGARIVAETQGNPLALVELGGELTRGELSGSSRLQAPLPLGRRLEERFLSRFRTLPGDTQTLLVLAAAEPSGDPRLLWRAAEQLGIGAEVGAVFGVDRLLTFAPSVSFRHPLIRSAVYQGASLHQRRKYTRRSPPPATPSWTLIAVHGISPRLHSVPTRTSRRSSSARQSARVSVAAGPVALPSSSVLPSSHPTSAIALYEGLPPPRPYRYAVCA